MAKVSDMTRYAQSLVGITEGSEEHQTLIALYNGNKPLPRGVKMNTSMNWCAMTASCIAIMANAKDIFPIECSCGRMIEKAKEMGIWIEDESITPKEGYFILYDWDDNGKGDNKGWPDHIGYVEKVTKGKITVIEGNFDNKVKRRSIEVNAAKIRGYIAPKYEAEAVSKPTSGGGKVNIELNVLEKGAKGEQVKTLQRLLIAMGYSCGTSGVDGSFGSATDSAVRKYQKANKLTVNGTVDKATWTSLLK